VVNLVVLSYVLCGQRLKKKRSSTFLKKKDHPRQNPGYAYAIYSHALIENSYLDFHACVFFNHFPCHFLLSD